MREVRRRLQIFLTLFLMVTVIGTAGFMTLEDLSIADAFYYNIVTMSTVGYGDIHPTHPASRMFAILLIVMGGATFLGAIANATEIFILKRESENRTRKVNMVLGIFFSEVGNQLMGLFSGHDNMDKGARENLLIGSDWTAERFSTSLRAIGNHTVAIDGSAVDFRELHGFLKSKRDFLLGLLENPVLIEHEDFSDLLLSVFHLLDELSCRNDLGALPRADLKHLTGDLNRVYKNLIVQWAIYLQHLKKEYPYLFSLAIRTNPFDEKASAAFTD